MISYPPLTEELLKTLTPRRRAVVKLRKGVGLSDEELLSVLPDWRGSAAEIRRRSLRHIADLLGVSKERIRQIEGDAVSLLAKAHSDQVARMHPETCLFQERQSQLPSDCPG